LRKKLSVGKSEIVAITMRIIMMCKVV